MTNVPLIRVGPARSFVNVRVDYTGPMYEKIRKIRQKRNKTKQKAYVTVYICINNRAIHLKLDLPAEAFIASLCIFVARRGKYYETNFVGAISQLRELHEIFQSDHHNQVINDYIVIEDCKWHFIPLIS